MDINRKILKALAGKETQEEFELLKKWQEDTKANIEAMTDYQDIWKQTEEMDSYKDFNAKEGWKEVEKNIGGSSPWLTWCIAATLLTLVGIAFWTYSESNKIPTEYNATESIQTFALQDQSNIKLNQNSKLNVVSEFKNSRTVALQGEAFFEIKRDETKPFKVEVSADRYVEVLGTSFNIKNDEIFEVYVTEGKVAVHDGHTKIELIKGDAVREHEGTLVKYRMLNDNYLSWIDKKMVFNDQPIFEVLNVIANTYDKEIEISDELLKSDCKLRTKFSNESLDNVLSELNKIFDLKYKLVENKIHFYYVKC